MTKQNQSNKQNNKKTDKIEVDIPRKLEKEVQQYNSKLDKISKSGTKSSSVGINTRTSKMVAERIHSVQGGVGANTLTVAGQCLLSVMETSAKYPTSNGSQNTFMLKRLFVHPGSVPSRRLHTFAALYTKYKFKRFDLKYEGEVNSTVNGALMTAYTKDYVPLEPQPGVSTRSWMSEMQGVREMKVWDNGKLGSLSKIGDLPSYYISKTTGEMDVTFQAEVLFAGVGLVPSSYYGDLYLDYEIDFSMPLVPPTNFNTQTQYTAAPGTSSHNLLTWYTEDAGQIEYWGPRQGIYFCSLAADVWAPFAKCKDYVDRNFFGSSFVLTVVSTITDGNLSNYKSVIFAVYADVAAALMGAEAMLEISEDDMAIPYLWFEGTLLFTVSPLVTSTRDPITTHVPNVVHTPSQNGGGLCGIGIGVGPGVFAGEPDIVPSIGFNGGRMVMGSPITRRHGL